MRWKPLTRSLPVLLVLVVFCAGCLGRSQSPRFYALSPIQEEQGGAKSRNPALDGAIGLGPVRLADYLDDSRIITRTGDHQLARAEYDRWAGSFRNNASNVLAENLGALLGTPRIYLYPWRTSLPIDYQVVVDVLRLDGRLGEAVWLTARWTVLAGPEKKLLKADRANFHEPVAGPDYAALVAAQSRALARLSQEIAAAIRGAGQH